jgi:hypothetical protein
MQMKPTRLTAIALLALTALLSCSKEDSQSAASSTGNTLLSYVPSASPYLAGNLEPAPDEVIDSFLHKAQPVLQTLQTELTRTRARLESTPGEGGSASRLLLALLQEVDGKLSRAGLEGLGLDLRSYRVLYAVGVFPVMRVSLSNPATLKATVQRILDNAGIVAPENSFQGQNYWRLPADDSSVEAGTFSPALYVAILQDHLMLGIVPRSAESDLLPALLGLEKPAISDARSRLSAVAKQYGFTPYFTGLLDLQMLADEVLQPDSLLARTIGASGAASLAQLSTECRNELRSIIGHTPRLVAGATELTPNVIGMRYVIETQPELAKQLLNLVADVPMADTASARMLELAFGLKLGAARDLLREKMAAITQAPYQCEHLQDLNEQAGAALARLDQPMLPLLNNFRGLRLSLSQVSMSQAIPASLQGMLALHVDQPEMFVGMAQMFLPDLASLALAKGQPPVQLPASLIPVPGVIAFAALSDDAIGISIGAGQEGGLPSYLQRAGSGDGAILSLNYDTAAYLDLTRQVSESLHGEAGGQDAAHADTAAAVSGEDVARQIALSMQQAFKAVADRSQLSLRFADSGLVIDSRMSFKQ